MDKLTREISDIINKFYNYQKLSDYEIQKLLNYIEILENELKRFINRFFILSL